MTEPEKREFYVGYLPQAPQRLGTFMRKIAPLLIVLVAAAGVVLTVSFGRLPLANFEFGTERSFVGTIMEQPYPALLVERPDAGQEHPSYSRYHLVKLGKRGAAEEVRGWEGKTVSLEGTLVYRDGHTMIELLDGSIRSADAPRVIAGESESLGEHRLRGEIVDSKCFLGVMNPGNLKPHRACAARCISGGIPPVLCVRDGTGPAVYFLLVDDHGAAVNDRVLEFIAEPLEITGEVVRLGEQLVLRADPNHYRRL